MDLSPKQLANAKAQAQYLANKITQAFIAQECKTWGDIERVFGLDLKMILPPGMPVTDAFRKAVPLTYNLAELLRQYVAHTERRLEQAEKDAADDLPKIKLKPTPDAQCYRFSKAGPGTKISRLFGEQDAVFRHIYALLFDNIQVEPGQPPIRAVLQNGKTGSGKTVVADAVVDRFIAEGRHKPNPDFPIPLPYPIIWITVANAVEQTKESLAEVGLGDELEKTIFVISYNDLSTEWGKIKFVDYTEEDDPFNPGTTIKTWKWKLSSICKLLVLDEAHNLQSEDAIRTEIIKSLDETERQCKNPLTQQPLFNMKVLYLTATPVERVADMRMFVCMTDIKYQGQRITYENFNTGFANIIANGSPDKVTKASTKRLWEVLRHRIIELPRVKWPHKAVNSVKLYEFETPEDRALYRAAWQRHCERCRLLGKDPDAGAEYTSLMIFAREVEPIRARQVVREMVANVMEGRTSVMATRFTDTIVRAVFELQDTYNIPRDQISIIWGGRKNIEPERLLTQDDTTKIMAEMSESGGTMSRETMRLIQRNMDWQKDRLLFGDVTDEAQAARYQRLKDLGLIGVQTKQKRQVEINKFKNGISKYCFFTADSGGTGLSLEHASDTTSQRYLWATPIYNGKQFVQVMGRCPRRVSWSDSIQYVCLMNGTIESQHVAPILDKKLQAAGEFTSQKDDIAMVLAGEKVRSTEFKKVEELDQALRSKEQVLADAESDAAQLYAPDAGVEDDGDDDDK